MSGNLSVTVDDVLNWDLCLLVPSRLREAMAGRERWTALDFIEAFGPETLSHDILLDLILRSQLIPADLLLQLACEFAEDLTAAASAAGYSPNPQSVASIETRRRWLQGEATDKEMWAVWEDEARVAWDAGGDDEAADVATWAAAGTARRAAVWVARAAGEEGAVIAYRARQLERIREVLSMPALVDD